MLRWVMVLAGAATMAVVDAPPLLAADWPDLGGPFTRGPGYYFSLWKILIFWSLFVLWVKSTDWVSEDSQALKLRWTRWNAIAFFSFFLAVLLFFILPWFGVGIVLMLIAYVAPLTAYVLHRNKAVPTSYDKVFTRKHILRVMARSLNKIGIKVGGEEDDDPRQSGPAIDFIAMGGPSDRENNINLITARQSVGSLPARTILDDALAERATHIMLDFTPEAMGLRHQIDGVWHERPGLEREPGDAALAVFKGLANLKVDNRRARQAGTFGFQIEKEKFTCKITSQGTQTGERALLQFETKKMPFKTLDDLGIRAKIQEQVMAMLDTSGMFIVTSMPGGGLTTTIDTLLSNTDRYIRNYVEVCDEAKPEREIENVHITTFSKAADESAATVLPKLIRTYPDVIVVRDVPDLETLSILVEQPGENRLVLTSIRAKDAGEALLRFLMLKIPPAEFANAVTGVLNVRLVRRLCEKCKEAYSPSAEVLKQLGLPAGKVESLYRPPTEPIDPKHPDVVCDQCQGIGYYGRTGIFELLVVDDDIRQVLITAPKMDKLRLAARKGKQRSLQEEGVLLVARGVTSIPELLRVLKQ